MLILSLFPGADLMGRAFEARGHCVVRGPDLMLGGDVKTFRPPRGRFDGVIGGPPCQSHSQLAHMVIANGCEPAEDLIPEFERVVRDAEPDWFLMEMVINGPEPRVGGYGVMSTTVTDWRLGGLTLRERRFSLGVAAAQPWFYIPELVDPPVTIPYPAVTCDARIEPEPIEGASVERPRATGGKTSSLSRRGVPGETRGGVLPLDEMARRQGFTPEELFGPDLDESAFKRSAMRKMVGNGVPRAMGAAVAEAVERSLAMLRKAA